MSRKQRQAPQTEITADPAPSDQTPAKETPGDETSGKRSLKKARTEQDPTPSATKGAPAQESHPAGTDLNLIVLRGRVATDPELRSFDSGATLLRVLVTTRTSEPRRTDVVPVTLWDPDESATAASRGERVWVTGSIQRRFWSGSEGRKSRLEVVASHLSRRSDDEPTARAL